MIKEHFWLTNAVLLSLAGIGVGSGRQEVECGEKVGEMVRTLYG